MWVHMAEQTCDGAQSGNADAGQQRTHPTVTVFWFHTACVFQEKLNQNKGGQEFSWQVAGTQCDVASKGGIPSNGETEIAPPARCDSLLAQDGPRTEGQKTLSRPLRRPRKRLIDKARKKKSRTFKDFSARFFVMERQKAMLIASSVIVLRWFEKK